MNRNIWFHGAAPLDPHQAGAELLLTLVLLSELGVVKISGRQPSASRPSPAPTSTNAVRSLRKRQPVRPPRAC